MARITKLSPYRQSMAGTLLSAREAVMTPIRPMLRAANITEQQWRVLRVLVDEGSLDVATLAAKAMLHGPSVTRILRELGERGLTVRQHDTNDRRRSIVAISPAGRELVDHTAQHTLVIINAYVEAFGRERLAHLLAELSAFRETLSALTFEED